MAAHSESYSARCSRTIRTARSLTSGEYLVCLLMLQSSQGLDTYAADVAAIVQALGLRDAIHIGHSTGGGEVARYVARAERGRVAKAVLIGAGTPVMVQSDANPDGIPPEVFDGFRAALAENRAQFYLDVPSGPFFGFNREGATHPDQINSDLLEFIRNG